MARRTRRSAGVSFLHAEAAPGGLERVVSFVTGAGDRGEESPSTASPRTRCGANPAITPPTPCTSPALPARLRSRRLPLVKGRGSRLASLNRAQWSSGAGQRSGGRGGRRWPWAEARVYCLGRMCSAGFRESVAPSGSTKPTRPPLVTPARGRAEERLQGPQG